MKPISSEMPWTVDQIQSTSLIVHDQVDRKISMKMKKIPGAVKSIESDKPNIFFSK